VAKLCQSVEETQEFAADLARNLRTGGLVLLRGGLGAGKTAFTRGFVRGLGGDQRLVNSPTYVIAQSYDLPGDRRCWHVDLYRLDGTGLASAGIDEIVEQAANGDVVVIEWPERAGDDLPPPDLVVELEAVSETERRVTVTSPPRTGCR
jgi:tRNA threonylcarbamoyladenosine biosynthesis protein TsaE